MKRIKPDDYFSDGIIEMARFGNTVIAHNNMTEEQHKEWISTIASHYEEEKESIDNLIRRIKENLSLVDPLMLFNFLTSINSIMLMSTDVTSEMDIPVDTNFQLRSVEYIQSLLVSMEHDKNIEIIDVEQEAIYHEISYMCTELYKKMPCFYIFWSAKQQETGNLRYEDEDYIIFAQMMSQVRGEQYQNFRIPVLQELLLPQETLIKEIYGLSVAEIISGLEIMEKNLSSGRLDALMELGDQVFDDREPDDDYKEECRKIAFKAVGTALYEVKENTNWTDTLINDLSLGVGCDNSFLAHDEFSGWPIWNLPIQYKPFIYLNGIAYCFDYYNLFDNFYVALQKAVRSHGNEYGKKWNDIQGKTSEKLVGTIFENLLPGCKIHYSNYYPINKNNSAENDILIEYKDVLFIIEVKAGTFVYTPAMMDFQAHKESFKALVEKAENQCLRVKKYINDCTENALPFYADDKLCNEAFSIDINNFTQIYMFDVTVSDFNEFASQMEKVKIANAHEDIITLSINDLWVYKYYFDNPFQFIHFVKQRTIATETVEVVTSDELDHLGMYISHNMYSLQVKDIGQRNHVIFMGYREELDKYFASVHVGRKYEKPIQFIPQEIRRILDISKDKKDQVTLFTNFLLDFSDDSRKSFAAAIEKLARREKGLDRMVPAIGFGDISYVLFVEVPGVSIVSDEKREEYIFANLAQNKWEECWSITVILDENENISDIRFKLYKQTDLSEHNRKNLQSYGKQ